MNKLSYIDICKGAFGRKVAYTSVSTITSENILKVVGRAVSILNYNRPFIRYLHDYYTGDQPILYREKAARPEINNKTVENHALEIVRFKKAKLTVNLSKDISRCLHSMVCTRPLLLKFSHTDHVRT